MTWIVALVCAALAQEAPVSPPPEVAVALARFDHEPTIVEVQTWALDAAGLAPRQVAAWGKDARRAAALPELRLEYGYGSDWGRGYATFDAYGSPPTRAEDAVEQVLTDADAGRDHDAGVRLTWDLPGVLMSSERLRALDLQLDALEARDALLDAVITTWFARRRLQLQLLSTPAVDTRVALEDALRLAELEARLDALTGGRFTAALKR